MMGSSVSVDPPFGIFGHIKIEFLIRAALTRDYGIQVEFNVSEAQYLGGMEMG